VGREQKMKFTESPRGWVTKVGGITWPGTIAPLHTPASVPAPLSAFSLSFAYLCQQS